MDMSLTQRQVQTLSPQLALTMKLLQMNAAELKEYLENISMENPVVELEAPEHTEEDNLLSELQWMSQRSRDSGAMEEKDAGRQHDELSGIAVQYMEEESLAFFLRCQLAGLRLPSETERAARWIIGNLDENGWYVRMRDEPFDEETGVRALRAVQSLEPAGVGARGLRECLLLQLERLPGDNKLAAEIVSDHLEDVARSRFNRIAKKIGISQERVRLACEQIAALNPKPSRGFDTPHTAGYIRPDIVVVREGDILRIRLEEHDIPVLYLNEYYCNMLKETQDEKTSAYLHEKVRQARWLRQSISQRKKTILKCMEVIADIQKKFFLGGESLLPMSLRDVAARAGVHESTVSRAIRGKYLQCDYGLFPLSRFFARKIQDDGEEAVTAGMVKTRIAELIDGEDKRKPLSDQQLSALLSCGGITVSRRTIAKYRTEMGLPPATGRKRL